MTGIVLIVFIIVIFAINGRRLYIEENTKAAAFIRDSFGKASKKKLSESRKNKLADYVKDYFSEKKTGKFVDELTWSDTGMNDIFLQMDNCFSSAGEEHLYRQLHDLSLSKDDIAYNDSIISELYEDEKLRESISLSLYRLGYHKDGILPRYLDKIVSSGRILNPFFHILCDVFYILVAVLAFYKPVIAVVFLLVIVSVQISSYFSIKKRSEEVLAGFSLIASLLGLEKMLPHKKDSGCGSLLDELSADLKKIKLKTNMSSFLVNSGSTSSGGLFSLLFTYLNLFFHFDLIAAEFLLRNIGSQKEVILSCYEKTGYLDMCLSVASYRAFLESMGSFSRPVFTDVANISIKGGFNPLLKDPVVNDAENGSGILITGSNASGKSTYMRMIAVNAILAQTVSTCPSAEYRASLFSIYSSIAVNDSILKGESYFMAEIGSLKRIVDASEQSDRPVICFIDEIFKGTNTSERIAAANAVLKYLRSRGVIVFAATHDLELTSLVGDSYRNVHFSEVIDGNDISFTYKLEDGPSNTRNAIALLKMKGFPENVILESEKMCSALDVSDSKKVY